MGVSIFAEPVTREFLRPFTLDGEMVKVVVDCAKGCIAVGGEMHADEEQVLLEAGSRQQDLWGINLYLSDKTADWLEYDSMINLRPTQGNRTRGVDDPHVRDAISELIRALVTA